MEEQVPPAGEDPSDDIPWPRRDSLGRHQNPYLEPLPPPPGLQLETYVVQYPKEQIYRVPPPEHAIFVERYRNPIKKERRYCKLILWIVIGLVVLGAIIGITLRSLYHAFDPKAPVFSITHVVVKSPPSSNHHKSHTGYKITLKANNQNDKMGIAYSSDGDASMIYMKKKIGKGKFPGLYQESNNLANVLVVLAGTNETFPRVIQKSIEKPKSHHEVSLALKMNLWVNFNVGPLSLWNRNMNIACNFKVSTLGKGTKVLSQHCNATLQ